MRKPNRRLLHAVAAGLLAVSGAAVAGTALTSTPAPAACQRIHGDLPDAACTPGETDPAVTQATIAATICRSGYTATVRNVPASERRQVLAAYGDHSPFQGELDHLISLELGGSNAPANLWPEPGRVPNAKDASENRLHRAVCTGELPLAEAQRRIRSDWHTATEGLR